ncbi:MAG TPA: aminodeoxychorismate synthase component I [Gemmatimonadales bacterium]|nr:aminodeoxychorismate synthase component I [Gemmatimonadales bacterium]
MGLVVPLDPPPDPLALCERLAHLPNLLFLDSASRGPTARYSYLMGDPARIFAGRVPDDTLAEAGKALEPFRGERDPALPPFQGGLAGFIGYDYGRVLERLPAPRVDDLDVPDVWLGLYDWVIAWDHGADAAWLLSTGLPERGAPAASRAEARATQVLALLETPAAPAASAAPAAPHITSTFTRAAYLGAVEAVREYILAGDVFQVNISQRFESPLTMAPIELYRRLRRRNPAAYAAYLDAGSFQVLSASPERFLRLDGDQVETRPIKGTRPRDPDPTRDLARASELVASEKDRAENVMIVDLLRNDLSRVCRPGSVEVPSLAALVSLPTVHHLVSTVAGRLEPGRDAFDLLRAAFPGGSITGAPKVRAMEIIAELEPTRRSVYCGSVGYISITGDMDTSIVIRTFLLTNGRAYFQAGGGVVADSDPAAEYAETLDKAAALVAALG